MKLHALFALTITLASLRAEPPPPVGKATPMFDGKTLTGWEGDAKLWRVEDGCLTGGSLTEQVTHNDFLATTKDYSNFVVRFKIKLTGTEGLSEGFTHSFVMLFENAAARDAYLPHPAHVAAAEAVVPRLARVIVCDHEIQY